MILGIDTSLGTSVAVTDSDGVVRAESSSDNPLGHAEAIGSLLTTALTDAARGPIGQTGAGEPVVLTHVAAGMGPGPFTGLRVGIAAARAFALGRGLPVIAVPSHDAAALAVFLGRALADPFGDVPRFAVVTDARRREFAFSVYDGIDDDGIPVRVEGPLLTPRDRIDDELAALDAERRDVTSIPASMIATLAARAAAAGRTLAGPEPLYLRAPDVTLPAARKRVGV
ncbi:tRNA (adenosine(37)-N6)-threonylcarbamoyltransferase complex dimerization subunit type 1 TsaB [Microbacterium flavum]|uniref:tRNA (Adenosine(37)-N6)-threonylcarbamoyltransferase complex dimerization subunit type 1 TsaB n=1 Tax=Microbacterium flavum TaxID=415216 RepID=A0ABS5XSP2_9MICO|nr:tRNA (adenosine(37)-N6)-threonylcarbamoyltransferase complex dimerization subunit type 1 TsaB [Microbacterium flavum]MBT8797533.1 tRNA (adenosine(37)-N6)-threonylcarbamoyltransferase complex dimerization subunit type 1 TsaB [Microbacterium flavum]